MNQESQNVEILRLENGSFVFVEKGQIKAPSQLSNPVLINESEIGDFLSRKELGFYRLGRLLIKTKKLLYPLVIVLVVAGGVLVFLFRSYLQNYVTVLVTAITNSEFAVNKLNEWSQFLGQPTPEALLRETTTHMAAESRTKALAGLQKGLVDQTSVVVGKQIGNFIVQKVLEEMGNAVPGVVLLTTFLIIFRK
jgi:hypothetical protein